MALVFMTSFLLLAFEAALARILSVTGWQFSAHLAIGPAMLGMGSAGVILALFPGWSRHTRSFFAAFLGALCIAFFHSFHVSIEPFKYVIFPAELFTLLAHAGVFSLPFLLGGLTLASIMIRNPDRIFQLYCADLGGAAMGSLSQLFLFTLIPAFFGTALLGATSEFKDVRQTLNHPQAKMAGAFTLLDGHYQLIRDPMDHATPGISINYDAELPPKTMLFHDGFFAGSIYDLDASAGGAAFADQLPSAVGFSLIHPHGSPRVLLLGLNTGWNVLMAANAGQQKRLTVVAENDAFFRALDIIGRNRGSTKDAYLKLLSGARVIPASTSRFFAGNRERFDLILASHTDLTQFPNSAQFSLAPSYGLSRETLSRIIKSLSPNGFFVLSGFRRTPDIQNARFARTLAEAASGTFLTLEDPFSMTYVCKGARLTQPDLDVIHRFAAKRSLKVYDHDALAPEHASLPTVTAVTQDNPFLARHFRLDHLRLFLNAAKNRSYSDLLPVADIPYVFLVLTFFSILGASTLLLLVALVIRPRSAEPPPAQRSCAASSLFLFSCYGLGYMLFEVSFIQRFGLYLDSLNTSLIVVLTGFLLFSGAGSYFARKFGLASALLCLVAAAGLACLMQIPMMRYTSGSPLPVRVLLSLFLMAPLAFFMGMPFPRTFDLISPRLRALAYAVNALASVNGATLATILITSLGFNATIGIAALLYAACMWLPPPNLRAMPGAKRRKYPRWRASRAGRTKEASCPIPRHRS